MAKLRKKLKGLIKGQRRKEKEERKKEESTGDIWRDIYMYKYECMEVTDGEKEEGMRGRKKMVNKLRASSLVGHRSWESILWSLQLF